MYIYPSYAYHMHMIWYDMILLHYIMYAYHVHNIKILISIYAYKIMYLYIMHINDMHRLDVCIISRLKLLYTV